MVREGIWSPEIGSGYQSPKLKVVWLNNDASVSPDSTTFIVI
jgi:hypothetical protein